MRASRAAFVVFLCAFSLGAATAGQLALGKHRPTFTGLAFGTAIACALLAQRLAGRGAALPSPAEDDLSPGVRRILLWLTLATGAFFLLYRIDSIPAGLNHDAAFEGLYSLKILQGIPYTPYTDYAFGLETMVFYLRAASIALFGTTILALQVPSVLAGFLILPAFFAWSRRMFGSSFAAIATFLLAVSGWHLIFARTGWRSDLLPLFIVLTCLSFTIGLERGHFLPFALAGIALAAVLNTYNGARLFPALLPLWLLFVLAASPNWRDELRRLRGGLAAMAVTFALAIAPLALYAVREWETFQARFHALKGTAKFGEALNSALLLFNLRGNGDDFFINEPALETPVAVFFVFGLVWVIRTIRDPRSQVLLAGMAVSLLPGLVSKPNLNRNIGTMPFVFLISGLGVMFFARQIETALRGRWARGAGVLFVSAVGFAAAWASYHEYLGPARRPIWGYYPETTVLGKYLRTLVGDYTILVGGANFPRDSLTYLTYPGEGDPMERRYRWLDDVLVLDQPTIGTEAGKGLALVLSTEGESGQLLERLRRRFPRHRSVDLRYPVDDGPVFARALLVAPRDVASGENPVAGTSQPFEGESLPEGPPSGLREPRGIAAEPEGGALVCDFGNDRIARLGADLKPVAFIGGPGETMGLFRQPCAVALDSAGRILVADTWNHRIQVLSKTGEALSELKEGLYGPRGVAVDKAGRVFVSDTGNNRVVCFVDAMTPPIILGRPGSAAGELSEPIGLAVDDGGRVFVADNGNGRVQVFGSDGRPVSSFVVRGWRSGPQLEPQLVLGRDGLVWVTVPAEGQVRGYEQDGDLRHTISDPAVRHPMGITLRGPGELIVTDLDGTVRAFSVPRP